MIPIPKSASLATAALAFFIYACLGLVAMHALRPDYALANHMISDYAVGRFGRVMATVFVALSAGVFLLMVSLLRSGANSFAQKFGASLLGIASIGLLVSAAYRTDLPGAPDTPEGNVHALSFLVNVLSLLIAIPLLSFHFRREPGWGAYRRTALILASLVVLTFFLQFFTLHKGMPYGLTNRLFVVVLLAWLISTAIHLRTLSAHEPLATSPGA